MQPPIAIARLLPRQLHQLLAQFNVAIRLGFIPIARPLHAQQLAGRAFAQPELDRDDLIPQDPASIGVPVLWDFRTLLSDYRQARPEAQMACRWMSLNESSASSRTILPPTHSAGTSRIPLRRRAGMSFWNLVIRDCK